MLSFVLPSCQVSWFFPVRSYAPHKTATMQLQPAPPPSFFNAPSPLFFCLIFPWKNTRQVWQEMRQMAGMTGGTFFWVFFFGKRKWKGTQTHDAPPQTLYLLDRQQAWENTTVSVHRHTHWYSFYAHTQKHTAYALYNKPVWCFGLGANRHSESVTA